MKISSLTILTLCTLLFFGCNSKIVDQSDSIEPGNITIKSGDTFEIKLESNPTTGYSWRLAESPSGTIQNISNVYEPRKTSGNIVGSGGTEIWTFKAVSKGNIILNFEYARPWEKDIKPIKKETYQITVK